MGAFWYGTSSWSEKGWKGVFYPEDLPAKDWLLHYGLQFPAVEADNTYYRAPSRKLVQGWCDKLPDRFRLCAKFPKDIVHAGEGPSPDGTKVLHPPACARVLETFLDSMSLMGSKLGPLVLQFPYFNKSAFSGLKAFLERLDPFLAGLPKDFRYGVEVRNRTWLTQDLLEVLRRHRTALVFVDLKYMPPPDELPPAEDFLTTDFAYLRLIGDRDATEALTQTFDRTVLDLSSRLARWADYLRPVFQRLPETYAFANNHFAGHAPATIRDLLALLAPGEASA